MTTAILTLWPGGHTVRHDLLHPLHCSWRNGWDRVTYDPTWSQTMPYKTFCGGTAKQIFGSLHAAIRYLGQPDLAQWTYHP